MDEGIKLVLWLFGVWILVGLIYLGWISREYRLRKKLSVISSLFGWLIYLVHLALVVVSSAKGYWQIAWETASLGWLLVVLGVLGYVWATWSLRSVVKMSGLKTDGLVTTGAYKYSRNPQNISWFLFLFGMALVGRSGLGLLMVLVLVVGFRFNLTIGEKHLGRVYGKEWESYSNKVSRWI